MYRRILPLVLLITLIAVSGTPAASLAQNPDPFPRIYSITPVEAKMGESITLRGFNFGTITPENYNSMSLLVTEVSTGNYVYFSPDDISAWNENEIIFKLDPKFSLLQPGVEYYFQVDKLGYFSYRYPYRIGLYKTFLPALVR